MPPMPPMPMPPMDVELPMLEVRVRKEDIMELFVPADADADPTVLERERLPLPSKGLGRRDCFFFLLGSLLSVTAVGKPGGRFTFTLGTSTSTSTSTSADGMMVTQYDFYCCCVFVRLCVLINELPCCCFISLSPMLSSSIVVKF